jgi:glycosyltransferase involved in cell wall biosynthesis
MESLEDTLLQVFAEKERWADLRNAGRRFVEAERNWARSVGRYRQVYERLAPP